MSVINLQDPEARARAIADGSVWSGPPGAQEAACQDIASGSVPMPAYLPDEAKARIMAIKGTDTLDAPGALADGSGPA